MGFENVAAGTGSASSVLPHIGDSATPALWRSETDTSSLRRLAGVVITSGARGGAGNNVTATWSLNDTSWENSSWWGNESLAATADPFPEPLSLWEIIVISILVSILVVLTAGGNLLVMISFKMDRKLQTISNYFLLSLSVADFAIGLISMPLYTVYILINRWPLGPIVCDAWLSIDYTMSNASVANLLVISVDRYLSVTRPLTYRAKRTHRRAVLMITVAWVVSALLWTPWIIGWPYIEGKRTIPEQECYIQFLETNKYITIVTAVAAYYMPVVLLCVLYFKIYLATEKRQKGLAKLQANRQFKKVDSSDDDATYARLAMRQSQQASIDYDTMERRRRTCWQRCKGCWKIDRDADDGDDSSSSDHTTSYPATRHSPNANAHRGILRRSGYHEPVAQNGKAGRRGDGPCALQIPLINVDSVASTPSALTPSTEMTATCSRYSNLSSCTTVGDEHHNRRANSSAAIPEVDRNRKDDASNMYTILIKLPEERGGTSRPTIHMIPAHEAASGDMSSQSRRLDSAGETTALNANGGGDRTEPQSPDGDTFVDAPSIGACLTDSSEAFRLAMEARMAAAASRTQRTRKKNGEKKADRKAAKTLSAILLAFIITWTPYNVFTVLLSFCPDCIDPKLYVFGKSPFYNNIAFSTITMSRTSVDTSTKVTWCTRQCSFARFPSLKQLH